MDEVVNKEIFSVVFVDGAPYITDNNICLQRKKDGQLLLTALSEDIKHMFLLPTIATSSATACDNLESPPTSAHSSLCGDETPSSSRLKVWPRKAILLLIEVVKNRQEQFKSTTMKNDVVWKEVAANMAAENYHYTSIQCKDKWKYLKGKYTKKRDNMSDRSTGTETLQFDYFEEMDAFLGKRHNIQPVALASSSGKTIVLSKPTEEVLDEEIPKKRKNQILQEITQLSF